MTAVALALHILGAVVWVGGMFAIYACLRPALGTLDLPQRLRLMRVTFQKKDLAVGADHPHICRYGGRNAYASVWTET
jgi:hypothetical protein